jgi:hypothetical protein
MPDDDFDRRLKAVVAVGTRDVASALKMKFTREQREEVGKVLEMLAFRWGDNLDELWFEPEDDDTTPADTTQH